MTTAANSVNETQEWSGRLSPADVHGVLFHRAGRGLRGYDETEVDIFLDRVEAELRRLISEKGELRDEAARLRSRLEETGSSGDEAVPRREEAALQAVSILSAAQQTADQYVADAEHYSRRVSSEARQAYEEILAEARDRSQAMLDEADRLAARSAGTIRRADGSDGDPSAAQRLEEQVAYLQTFSQVCRTQLRAYLEALLRDIEEEWGRANPEAVMRRSIPSGRSPLNGATRMDQDDDAVVLDLDADPVADHPDGSAAARD